MTSFVQHVVAGLANGGVYGLLALALVIVHRSSGVLNFAQGEMATLSAFVCWALVAHGWSFWPALASTLILSFAGGVAIEQVLIRPLQGGPKVRIVILTVGLLLALNGLTTWVWGGATRQLRGPFSPSSVTVGGAVLSKRDLGVTGVALVVALLVGLLLTRTKTGLGLMAAAVNPAEARLVGIHVGAMQAVGWGVAAGAGSVAGVLAAPSLGLTPTMLQTTLLYAFAAALLGGMNSPAGAVVGGLALGVLLELVGAYIHWLGAELRPATALVVILAVLVMRPAGLRGEGAVAPA